MSPTDAPDWTPTVITSSPIDNLLTVTPTLNAGQLYSSALIPCTHPYGGVLVSVAPEAGGAGTRIGVKLFNDTRGIYSAWQTVKVPSETATDPVGAPTLLLGFPIPCDQNDQLVVYCYALDTTFVLLDVVGVDKLPPNLPRLRTDGRLPPSGLAVGSGALSAIGTVTVIPAPGAALRILLKSVQGLIAATGGGNGFIDVNATIGGGVQEPMALQASSTAGDHDHLVFPDGLLLDVNTALTMHESGVNATARVSATYDVVL